MNRSAPSIKKEFRKIAPHILRNFDLIPKVIFMLPNLQHTTSHSRKTHPFCGFSDIASFTFDFFMSRLQSTLHLFSLNSLDFPKYPGNRRNW